MGRITTYSEEIVEEICHRISEGTPLRVICRDDHMPAWRTVYDWKRSHENFAARFARARTMGFDAIAEEILEIVDTPLMGKRTESSEDGMKVVIEDMLGHRKLQAETRFKLLAKWDPTRYGDRLDLTSKGEALNMSAEERAAKLAALMAVAEKRREQAEGVPDADE